jgi:TolB-like protein/DNA-binding winged helix-turn-helix (wHTH) protein/Tfp pilus assembly protein PilF
MPTPAPIYRFGSFELRPRTRELYKAGTKLRLRPQPFQVLQLLAERAGDVVSREELRESLWSKETFVDFEHGLNTSIKELRGVLSDSANKPRYIETLPKLGYRMIVPVELAEPLGEDQPQTRVAENLGRERSASERLPKAPAARRWPALAVSLVLIAALGAYFLWSRSRARVQPPGGRAMLAVLPFENLTGDASQDYFSDGLTEEMIGQLGRLDPQHLGVIARTSVMHYKRSQEPLQQIGSALGVQYVLEGSVRRDSSNVRISAQLIQLKDQTHLWSRQYDRELGSLLALQGEIAREAAEEIQVTLGVPKHIEVAVRDRSAVSPDSKAYELYLKGLYFWNRRTVAGFNQAIEYFQQAISKDPNYAPAYAGLADCYALIGGYSTAPQTEFMPKARAAALRALQINDGLAQAHTALALIVQNYDWDWEASEREYRRAIELDPNYATAHHWYAEHLSWLGRFDEASHESERARQLDPLSLIIVADHAEILYISRQYDRAIEELRAVREMEPNFPRAGLLVNALVEKGLFEDALAETARERRAFGDGPWLWETLAYVYGRSRKQKQGRHAIHELEQLNQRQRIDPASIAWGYVALGDKDRAFSWMEKAYAQHSNVLHTLKVEPGFDPVRNDPRFQDLLRRVGLAQ